MGQSEKADNFVPDLRSPPRNTAPSYPVVDVQPPKDVLRTPESILATESEGAAAIPIMDDFFSYEANLNFLDRILGYESLQKSQSA